MNIDQNGRENEGEELWRKHCPHDKGSDGERITTCKAIEIAFDVSKAFLEIGQGASVHAMFRQMPWTRNDIEIAMGVLHMIRAQAGVMGPDANALGKPDGLMATEQLDIWIYG